MYEYKLISSGWEGHKEKMQEVNELAAAGWRVVHFNVCEGVVDGYAYTAFYWFLEFSAIKA